MSKKNKENNEENLKKKKKSPFKVLKNIITVIVVFAVVFCLGVRGYFRIPVSDYYKASIKGFVIPGLGDGFIPQGIDYAEKDGAFFITGYTKDGSSSPVYVVDKASKKLIHTAFLATENGEPFTGHAGGLSVHGDYVYVADHAGLLVFNYADIMKAEKKGTTVKSIGRFSTSVSNEDYVGVAFTAINDGKLYVGEFHREENYKTLDSHKVTTAAGDRNTAITVAFRFSDAEGTSFGLETTPCEAFSMGSLVQGMAFDDGKVYLSTSYGPSKSTIYGYDLATAKTDKKYTVLGTEVDLYELDSSSQVFASVIAPMSEEIVFVDGRMYTMCESASSKYIFGKFTSGRNCFATKISELPGAVFAH